MSTQSTPPEAAVARTLIGKTVGRFAVDARRGAGGMGEVYRARDTKLRRTVALKRVAAHLCVNENSRERLWRDALCASRLNDPHIAAIHDAFEDRGEIFLVMEYARVKRFICWQNLRALSEIGGLYAQIQPVAFRRDANEQRRNARPAQRIKKPCDRAPAWTMS